MGRVWMEDVFKFDSFRFRAAHHHFGLFCQQEKENSPAVCIGLTPGGTRRLPWFRKEFRLFFLLLFNLKSADCNLFYVCKPYYK